MDSKDLEAASTFYPCMQAADIFQMKLDVACAGMDQRKAHVLARDVAEKLGWHKPTSLHTPLLMGLLGSGRMDSTQYDENPDLSTQISLKMSKSIPESSIIIHDEPELIRSKLRSAYCPPKEIKDNPVIDTVRQVLLPWTDSIEINRPEKYGGPLEFTRIEELETQYRDGKIHPLDLKNSVAEQLIRILEPVREEFQRRPELLQKMEQLQATR
jgi:tyrosyl-tRNA synthetase